MLSGVLEDSVADFSWKCEQVWRHADRFLRKLNEALRCKASNDGEEIFRESRNMSVRVSADQAQILAAGIYELPAQDRVASVTRLRVLAYVVATPQSSGLVVHQPYRSQSFSSTPFVAASLHLVRSSCRTWHDFYASSRERDGGTIPLN